MVVVLTCDFLQKICFGGEKDMFTCHSCLENHVRVPVLIVYISTFVYAEWTHCVCCKFFYKLKSLLKSKFANTQQTVMLNFYVKQYLLVDRQFSCGQAGVALPGALVDGLCFVLLEKVVDHRQWEMRRQHLNDTSIHEVYQSSG